MMPHRILGSALYLPEAGDEDRRGWRTKLDFLRARRYAERARHFVTDVFHIHLQICSPRIPNMRFRLPRIVLLFSAILGVTRFVFIQMYDGQTAIIIYFMRTNTLR